MHVLADGWRDRWAGWLGRPRVRLALGALGYLPLIALLVGPGRLLSAGAVVGLPTHDLFDHVWLHDGLFDILTGGDSALTTTDIAWPEGGAILHPDPTGALLYVLMAPLLGSTLAFNAMLGLQLWFAALAGWALARRVTGSAVAGWFGGLLMGGSPYLLGQVNTGETETVAAWPLILALLFLERLAESRTWRDGLLAGLFAGLGAVASWYHGAFLVFYLGAWMALRGRSRACLAVPLGFAAVVALPAAIYASMLGHGENLFQGPDMATYLAEHTDALAGMVTDPASLLGFAPAATSAAGHVRAQYVGTIVLALAVCGAFRGWRGARWWVGVALGALVMAMGPVLFVAGQTASVEGNTVPLPYRLLSDHLPLFGLMRIPHRWTLLVAVALATLAARGLTHVARDRRTLWVAVGLATAMHLCDLGLFARLDRGSSVDVTAPDMQSRLPGSGAVLDLPPRMAGQDARGLYLVWQRVHGRPVPYSLLMSGMSPTAAEEPLLAAVAALDLRDQLVESDAPVVGAIEPQLESGNAAFRAAWAETDGSEGESLSYALTVARMREEGVDTADVEGAADRLRALGFDTVVLHRDLLRGEEDAGAIHSLLVATLGEPVTWDDETVVWSLGEEG